MATKAQFDVFKDAYNAEDERHNHLGTRANVYITVVTFFLGALFFRIDVFLKITSESMEALIALLFTWCCLFVSLLFAFISLQIRDFELPFVPSEAAEELDEDGMTEDEFLDNRVVDFSVVLDRNLEANNRIGTWLELAGYALLIGLTCAIIFLTIALFVPVALK